MCKHVSFHKAISQRRALTLHCFNFQPAEKRSGGREGEGKQRGGYGIKVKLLLEIHIALKHKQQDNICADTAESSVINLYSVRLGFVSLPEVTGKRQALRKSASDNTSV